MRRDGAGENRGRGRSHRGEFQKRRLLMFGRIVNLHLVDAHLRTRRVDVIAPSCVDSLSLCDSRFDQDEVLPLIESANIGWLQMLGRSSPWHSAAWHWSPTQRDSRLFLLPIMPCRLDGGPRTYIHGIWIYVRDEDGASKRIRMDSSESGQCAVLAFPFFSQMPRAFPNRYRYKLQ